MRRTLGGLGLIAVGTVMFLLSYRVQGEPLLAWLLATSVVGAAGVLLIWHRAD